MISSVLSIILFFSTAQAETRDCSPVEKGIKEVLISGWTAIENFICEPKIGRPMDLIEGTKPVQRVYRLTKMSEKKYLAEINLNFIDVRTDKLSAKNPAKFKKERKAAVQKCLDQYAPYLKGPNGESLTINISNNAPVHNIYFRDDSYRPDNFDYTAAMSCPTLLHEVFHLFGLTDEYKETASGYITDKVTGKKIFVKKNAEVLAYDCRTVTENPSVMNQEAEAVFNALPHYVNEVCTCDVRLPIAKILQCQKNFKSKKAQLTANGDCPKNSKPQTYESALPNNDPLTLNLKPSKKVNGTGSLLLPAQFRMITNPNCESANAHYLECAAFAYTSSQELPTQKCSAKAIQCKKKGDWLN